MESALERSQQRFQACGGIVAEVHVQGTTVGALQGLQVALGLGILQGAEGVGTAG